MNDDFESKLQSLRPRALPETWRAEILGMALRRPAGPPRWLVAGWSVAWAAVIMLHVLTPVEPVGPLARSASSVQTGLQKRAQTLNALLAFNHDSATLNP